MSFEPGQVVPIVPAAFKPPFAAGLLFRTPWPLVSGILGVTSLSRFCGSFSCLLHRPRVFCAWCILLTVDVSRCRNRVYAAPFRASAPPPVRWVGAIRDRAARTPRQSSVFLCDWSPWPLGKRARTKRSCISWRFGSIHFFRDLNTKYFPCFRPVSDPAWTLNEP